jgi:hypothetical protein
VRRVSAWQATAPSTNHAPVLVVERIFEPPFCRALIDYCRTQQTTDSGVMLEQEGFTVGQLNHDIKRRRDCLIEDERLRNAAMSRIYRRLVPRFTAPTSRCANRAAHRCALRFRGRRLL